MSGRWASPEQYAAPVEPDVRRRPGCWLLLIVVLAWRYRHGNR